MEPGNSPRLTCQWSTVPRRRPRRAGARCRPGPSAWSPRRPAPLLLVVGHAVHVAGHLGAVEVGDLAGKGCGARLMWTRLLLIVAPAGVGDVSRATRPRSNSWVPLALRCGRDVPDAGSVGLDEPHHPARRPPVSSVLEHDQLVGLRGDLLELAQGSRGEGGVRRAVAVLLLRRRRGRRPRCRNAGRPRGSRGSAARRRRCPRPGSRTAATGAVSAGPRSTCGGAWLSFLASSAGPPRTQQPWPHGHAEQAGHDRDRADTGPPPPARRAWR